MVGIRLAWGVNHQQKVWSHLTICMTQTAQSNYLALLVYLFQMEDLVDQSAGEGGFGKTFS